MTPFPGYIPPAKLTVSGVPADWHRGEFIAHYFRPECGDIILNPFDARYQRRGARRDAIASIRRWLAPDFRIRHYNFS